MDFPLTLARIVFRPSGASAAESLISRLVVPVLADTFGSALATGRAQRWICDANYSSPGSVAARLVSAAKLPFARAASSGDRRHIVVMCLENNNIPVFRYLYISLRKIA
jgi:hypothetical protein